MQKIKDRIQTYKVETDENENKAKLVNVLKQLKLSVETLRTTSEERYKNIQDELMKIKNNYELLNNRFNELQNINTETFEKLTQTLENHKNAIDNILGIDV